jgi:hypothetical protein
MRAGTRPEAPKSCGRDDVGGGSATAQASPEAPKSYGRNDVGGGGANAQARAPWPRWPTGSPISGCRAHACPLYSDSSAEPT